MLLFILNCIGPSPRPGLCWGLQPVSGPCCHRIALWWALGSGCLTVSSSIHHGPPEMLSQAWSRVQSRAPLTCCEDLNAVMPCMLPKLATLPGLQGDKGPGKTATDLECPGLFPESLAGLLTIPSQLSVVLDVSSRGPISLLPPLCSCL